MRILLKISGEALSGSKSRGVDIGYIHSVVNQIKKIREKGHQIVIVMGGGNFFRGIESDEGLIHQTTADNVGILAIIMNGLILRDMLNGLGVDTSLYSSKGVEGIINTFIAEQARIDLDNGKIIVLAGGIGMPFFTSDTGGVLRALETECDYFIKFTDVDGVYSENPKTHPDATLYDTISFEEVISKGLQVMDTTAFTLAKNNGLKVLVTNMSKLEELGDKNIEDIKGTILTD